MRFFKRRVTGAGEVRRPDAEQGPAAGAAPDEAEPLVPALEELPRVTQDDEGRQIEANAEAGCGDEGPRDLLSALDGLRPPALRLAACLAMAAAVSALLLAPLGRGLRLWLAGLAVAGALLANGGLISFATSHSPRGLYTPMTGAVETARLDKWTCALGYAMVPITMISVICLALYKADADHNSVGRRAATKHAATTFLRFVGCPDIAEAERHMDRKTTAVILRSKFLGVALLAAVLYLGTLALRAACSAWKSLGTEAEEQGWRPKAREAMSFVFAIAIVLVVFGAAGFFPIVFSCIACGLSLLASLAMLTTGPEWNASGGHGFISLWKHMQVHAFNLVTLCCVYCLGCALLERSAVNEENSTWEVQVRLLGFQLAFSAAAWLAAIVAACDLLSSKWAA